MRVKLISVTDLLSKLNNTFTWDQLKTLRKRYSLFVGSIPLGRVSYKKGGATRYLPEESVAYLKKIAELRYEDLSFPEIAEKLRPETEKLRRLRKIALEQQLNINQPTLDLAKEEIESIWQKAQKYGLKASDLSLLSLDITYEKLLDFYEKEKNKLRKKELKCLVLQFARFLRTSARSSKM